MPQCSPVAGTETSTTLDRGGNLGRQPWTDYAHYSGDIKFNYLVDELHMLTVALQHYEQEDVARSDRHPNRLTVFDPQQRSMIYLRYQGANLPYVFDRYAFTVSYQRQRQGSSDHRLSTTNLDVGEVDNHSFGLSWLMSTDLWECGQLTYGFDHYHDEVNAFKNRFELDHREFRRELARPLTPMMVSMNRQAPFCSGMLISPPGSPQSLAFATAA